MAHTFTSAYERLKEIHATLTEKDVLDIDLMIALQKEAKELHDFLLQHLHAMEENAKK